MYSKYSESAKNNGLLDTPWRNIVTSVIRKLKEIGSVECDCR